MNCPVCDVPLRATDREGVEIDHCPECRGVWLDRGELDKIIERSIVAASHEGEDDQEGDPAKRRTSRRSFLGDLFDFE